MSIRKNGEIIAGVNPLYDTTGQNTDGAMTQKAVTDELENKADITDLDSKVSKSGDTMTGDLITPYVKVSKATTGAVDVQNTSVDKDIAPSTSAGTQYFRFLDKNGNTMGQIGLERYTDGSHCMKMQVYAPDMKSAPAFRVRKSNTGKVVYEPVQLITTYVSGTSGYNIWSNGYCEQWGQKAVTTSNTTISFSKTFKDTNYNVQATSFAGGYCVLISQAAASCVLKVSSNNNVKWRACGYLATNQY